MWGCAVFSPCEAGVPMKASWTCCMSAFVCCCCYWSLISCSCSSKFSWPGLVWQHPQPFSQSPRATWAGMFGGLVGEWHGGAVAYLRVRKAGHEPQLLLDEIPPEAGLPGLWNGQLCPRSDLRLGWSRAQASWRSEHGAETPCPSTAAALRSSVLLRTCPPPHTHTEDHQPAPLRQQGNAHPCCEPPRAQSPWFCWLALAQAPIHFGIESGCKSFLSTEHHH